MTRHSMRLVKLRFWQNRFGKGDKTPQQANMNLARRPKRPHFIPYLALPVYLKARSRVEWLDYLPVFEEFERAFHVV